MFKLEIDEASSKSIWPIQRYGPKRATMSQIFFSTKVLLRTLLGKILLFRFLDTKQRIVSTSNVVALKATVFRQEKPAELLVHLKCAKNANS